ncbi:MAG: MBL fold metallo-hydrolase, partial [Myxococcales bacterium]
MTNAVHHLNCATMAPRLAFGGRVTPERMVAHVLLIEGDQGLTLVDSGFGTEDIRTRRMGRGFITMMGAALDPAETAVAQVRALGHDPADVTDIVLTHLDLDHAGGIGDFPQARVHVFADELAAATQRMSVKEKNRYIPGQWSHGPQWEEHQASGEEWLGFSSVKVIGEDVLMIPLVGHTRGHGGVGVRRPDGTWLLHAGDSYFSAGEKQTPPTCPSGLAAFQNFVQMDKKARHENQDRLRALHADHPEVTM